MKPILQPEPGSAVFAGRDTEGRACFEIHDRCGGMFTAPVKVACVPGHVAGSDLNAEMAWRIYKGEEVWRFARTLVSPLAVVHFFADGATTPEGLLRVEDVRCFYEFRLDGSPLRSSYLVRHPVLGRDGDDDANRVRIAQAIAGPPVIPLTARHAHQLVHGKAILLPDGQGCEFRLEPPRLDRFKTMGSHRPAADFRAVLPPPVLVPPPAEEEEADEEEAALAA